MAQERRPWSARPGSPCSSRPGSTHPSSPTFSDPWKASPSPESRPGRSGVSDDQNPVYVKGRVRGRVRGMLAWGTRSGPDRTPCLQQLRRWKRVCSPFATRAPKILKPGPPTQGLLELEDCYSPPHTEPGCFDPSTSGGAQKKRRFPPLRERSSALNDPSRSRIARPTPGCQASDVSRIAVPFGRRRMWVGKDSTRE